MYYFSFNCTTVIIITYLFIDEICLNIIEVPLPEIKNNLERIRYKVFKDLWSKGFYLTCGMKFGGDFLVYRGLINKLKYF